MHPLRRSRVGGMGGAGGDPISRDNVGFWIFQTGTLHSIRSATPCKQGCAADSKRCAGTAAHHHGAGAGAGAGVGSGAGAVAGAAASPGAGAGADAGAGAGALLGSFWGPGLLIWGLFWLILVDLGFLLGISLRSSGQQLKTSKTAPVCSARPVLPKRFPPSVLALRDDLFVFPYPKSQTNTQITTHGEHTRGQHVWLKGPGAAERCCF